MCSASYKRNSLIFGSSNGTIVSKLCGNERYIFKTEFHGFLRIIDYLREGLRHAGIVFGVKSAEAHQVTAKGCRRFEIEV